MNALKEIAENINSTLGGGFSERVYHNAFEVSLRKLNIPYESERIIPIVFDGHTIGNLRADLIVDKNIIVELKSVKGSLSSGPYETQIKQYMKLTGINNGLLINFNGSALCDMMVIKWE